MGAAALGKAATGLRQLVWTPHFVLRMDTSRHLLIVTRSHLPFENLRDLQSVFDQFEAALEGVPRGVMSVIADSRRSHARNDPEFEELFARLRRRFTARCRLIATYMATAVGVLHSKRYAQADGTTFFVSTDLREISAYLGVPLEPAELDLDFGWGP